jgi:hypothetical protein
VEFAKEINDIREYRLYELGRYSWYNINSITYLQPGEDKEKDCKLLYSYFNKGNNELSLHFKDDTLIAQAVDSMAYFANREFIDKTLINFGKCYAKHLGIRFISRTLGVFRCYDCNSIIGSSPIQIEKYSLIKEEFNFDKLNKRKMPSVSKSQIKREVSRIIKLYNAHIGKEIYCEHCLKNIKEKYLKLIVSDDIIYNKLNV